MTDDTEFRVRDGEREFTFTGCVIGEASSGSPDRDRWTDIVIYRTAAGSYIVTIVGRTTYDDEHERHKAQVSETAAGAVESLYLLDGDGVRYMTNTAKRAARAATDLDPQFAEAYLVEHVA